MIIVLFGPPGSGKGTQAHNLEVREGFLHISTGNLLRDAVAKDTPLGREVKEILASGQLVSDDLVLSLLRQALLNSPTDRIVLDGFPRNIDQVKMLDDLLSSLGKQLDLVVSLEVDSLLLIERMTGRFSCKSCGAGYHRLYKKTAQQGVCDSCGSTQFLVREDDQLSVVSKRIDIYLQQTLPILSLYSTRGIVHALDGSQMPDKVFEEIKVSLKSVVKEAI